MNKKKPSFSKRLKYAFTGRAKELIPSLDPIDGVNFPSLGNHINNYLDKPAQLAALTGWVFAANSAIVEPTAAIQLVLRRKNKDGTKADVTSGPAMEILELFNAPNMIHTGEQMRQLHFTYMNIVGESYILMRDLDGGPFTPAPGKLPAALDIFPAHLVTFTLGETYTKSTVKLSNTEYPVTSFIRDINPDPNNPYNGRSIIAASAAAIDLDEKMKEWNQSLFANSARPSLIVSTNTPVDDDSFARFKEQFSDEHAGSDNAYKPILVEDATVTPWMMNATDLDFLNSRKFSQTEIFAMFKVSPGMVGIVENVNRSNLEAGFYVNAVVNEVPRIRQFVSQVNATLIKVYDPTLELDFINPVPEDLAAKLQAATQGVDKWWTKDEVRAMYGEKALPGGIGDSIIVQGLAPITLEDVFAKDDPKPVAVQDPEDPSGAGDGEDDITEDPSDKSLIGVKKKTFRN